MPLRHPVGALAVARALVAAVALAFLSGITLPVRAGGPVLVRGPYLQQTSSSEVTVRWRTDQTTSSRLIYGDAPGNLVFSQIDTTPRTEHEITLTGLPADTKHFYAVGDDVTIFAGDDADHFFVTAPPVGTARPMRVWVLGDSGTGSSSATAVRDAYYTFTSGRATDLWLMLGDNAYPSGTDAEYQTKLFDIYPEVLRQSPLWPALGNHDAVSSHSATQSGPYFDMFTLPAGAEAGGVASGTEAYYSFDYGNVHFVVLDSHGSDRSPGGAMASWLQTDLAATSQDWILAYWHHPPYSKGSHDSDTELQLVEMRTNIVPVLEAHGVDLTLSGHSHSYERSVLIDGHYGDSTTFGPAMEVDPGDGRSEGDGVYWKQVLGPDPHAGAVYTVAGCSGQISGGTLDHPVMSVSLNTLGSVVLDIDGNKLDASFLDSTGVIQDHFTILKGCPDSDRSFSSRDLSVPNESFVYTPGLCDAGPPCSSGSSISPDLAGSFWRLGSGDPAPAQGIDNGSFAALGGWVHDNSPDPADIGGVWSPEAGIDCVANEPGSACMSILLGDQAGGIGYFAQLTAAADATNDYGFDQPSGGRITLAEIPKPPILGSSTVNSYTKQIDTNITSVSSAGYYFDAPGCPAGGAVGYRVYQQQTDRDVAPSTDRRRVGGPWTLADGGELVTGEPIPLGTPTVLTATCYTAIDVYFGTSLVFDSGFETPVVSRDSSWILCSNCGTDDDLDGSCFWFITGSNGPDCDDGDANVLPGAPQICGDQKNNDCDHASWPALDGTNEFDDDADTATECDGDCNDADSSVWGVSGAAGNLRWSTDRETLMWDPPMQPNSISVLYDLLRSTSASDFVGSGVCLLGDGATTSGVDAAQPSPGGVFFYLARPQNDCGLGSLGAGSPGTPQRAGLDCFP